VAKLPAKVSKKATTLQKVTNLMSSLMGRMQFLQRAGLQYGGKRDIYNMAGYIKAGEDRFDDYWSLYTRGDVAGRIVDMPAKTTWRSPPEISEDDKPDGTQFTEAVEEMADRLHLWRYFERADRLAGVGEFAVIFLGVKGADDIALKTPLNKLTRPEDLIYLQVFHQGSTTIQSWVQDPGDPRFGQPLLYKVSLSSGRNGFNRSTMTVHYSRLIHVAEDLVQDETFGRPRLQRCLNRLFDLEKITASVGESFWQAATRILQGKISTDVEATPEQVEDLEEKLAEMVHDLRRQFIGQGTELGWLPVDVPEPKNITDLYFELISAACGIPRRILFGNEVGELASSTDQATYFGMINERQEHFAEPQILRAFLDRMIKAGALPKPTSDNYNVTWPNLFELTELENADANLKRAQTAQALTAVGADPLALVEIDEDRNVWLVPREPAEEERPLVPTPTEPPGTGTQPPGTPEEPVPPAPQDGADDDVDEEDDQPAA